MSEELAFNVLINRIYSKTCLDFSRYKRGYIKRRISGRMRAIGVNSYAQYLRYLEKNPEEYAHIMDSVAINVTEFFRDPGTFFAFRNEVLPEILSRKIGRKSRGEKVCGEAEKWRGNVLGSCDYGARSDCEKHGGNNDGMRATGCVGLGVQREALRSGAERSGTERSGTLRIWSAGCASGEEPYTIAIILLEELGDNLGNLLVSILATDIDDDALKKAMQGFYQPFSLKNIPPNILKKYFHSENGGYRIKDVVKRLVRFRKHDLISGEKLRYFDVIFCRNVMIYFSRELQERLFMDFYNSLNDGGFLIIGKTETLTGEAREKFICVNVQERIFRKPPR